MELIFAFVITYSLFIGLLYLTQRNYFYFPAPGRPNPAMAGVSDMNVIAVQTDDGLEVQGWYKAPHDASKPVVMLFHGNGGNIDIRAFKARPVLDAGYGFLLAEYRGYGGNPGKPSEQGFYKDGHAYIKAVTDQGVKSIILYGESLGTGVAVQLATEYSDVVKGVILETPYASLAGIAQRHMMFVPIYVIMKDRFDSVKKIGKVKTPVLFLHGTADMIVPYSSGMKLFNAANDPKILQTFKGGGHNDLYNFGAGAAVLSFLNDLPKSQ